MGQALTGHEKQGVTLMEISEKAFFVILSGAKDLVFLRFFGRFAPSE